MASKLRIAQIAPLWFTIPPPAYGGTERIVANLCNGLTDLGHDVTLYGAPGSATKAKLISVSDYPLIEGGISWHNQMWNMKNLARAFEDAAAGKYDIIHSHMDVWGMYFNNISKVPVVHTLHNQLSQQQEEENPTNPRRGRFDIFKDSRHNANLVYISERMKIMAGFESKTDTVIYNGIDTKSFIFNSDPDDTFVWVARMSPRKGADMAIQAAKKARARLLMAGRIDAERMEYFNNEIAPHLSESIKYIGELKRDELSKFYGNAKAFLYPIDWEEPFGLVVVEAMSTGTPVIAFNRGAMSELIDDGKTGFLVNNVDEMVEAMKKIGTIDRAYVFEQAQKRWSTERMVNDYNILYNKLCV